jgi:hypothetical protein
MPVSFIHQKRREKYTVQEKILRMNFKMIFQEKKCLEKKNARIMSFILNFGKN